MLIGTPYPYQLSVGWNSDNNGFVFTSNNYDGTGNGNNSVASNKNNVYYDSLVYYNIRLSEGGLYNRLLSDQSLRSLYNTNYFEFVDFRITEVDGITELSIHLTAKYKLEQIQFSGNENFSAKRLLEEGDI